MIETRQLTHATVGMMTIALLVILGMNPTFAANKPEYKAAILIDVETGQILFEKNAHEKAIPASMVKMMTLLLTMEKLQKGEINVSDIVTVSAWASKIGGHQVYLAEGEQFTLGELLKAIAIGSANDAATAIAEFVGGDADAFVQLMNFRAKELGMRDTVFANEHGLPPDKGQQENYTTAYDIAILGEELLKYPKVLEMTSTIEDTFRNGTFTLTNTNRDLLNRYQGVDGLKTGYHSQGAGFNVCATAQRNDRRLLAVVMGAPRKNDRDKTVMSLFNIGFNQYERVVVLRKGFSVGDPILINQGKQRTTRLVAAENAVVLVKQGQKQEITQKVDIPFNYMIAPVKQGTRFGEAIISLDAEVVTRVDLVTETDIKKGSLFDRLKWWIVNKIS